jgi:hypothetical protein
MQQFSDMEGLSESCLETLRGDRHLIDKYIDCLVVGEANTKSMRGMMTMLSKFVGTIDVNMCCPITLNLANISIRS